MHLLVITYHQFAAQSGRHDLPLSCLRLAPNPEHKKNTQTIKLPTVVSKHVSAHPTSPSTSPTPPPPPSPHHPQRYFRSTFNTAQIHPIFSQRRISHFHQRSLWIPLYQQQQKPKNNMSPLHLRRQLQQMGFLRFILRERILWSRLSSRFWSLQFRIRDSNKRCCGIEYYVINFFFSFFNINSRHHYYSNHDYFR